MPRQTRKPDFCKAVTVRVASDVVSKLTPNEKVGVRFGLFPAHLMQEADKDIALQNVWPNPVDRARELAVAVMEVSR